MGAIGEVIWGTEDPTPAAARDLEVTGVTVVDAGCGAKDPRGFASIRLSGVGDVGDAGPHMLMGCAERGETAVSTWFAGVLSGATRSAMVMVAGNQYQDCRPILYVAVFAEIYKFCLCHSI
jgi:hypothetical protein